jgi:hypothetical protein
VTEVVANHTHHHTHTSPAYASSWVHTAVRALLPIAGIGLAAVTYMSFSTTSQFGAGGGEGVEAAKDDIALPYGIASFAFAITVIVLYVVAVLFMLPRLAHGSGGDSDGDGGGHVHGVGGGAKSGSNNTYNSGGEVQHMTPLSGASKRAEAAYVGDEYRSL